MMWAGLYTLGIRFYLLGIHLAALFYPKARKWLRGRKNQFIQPLQKADGRMRIWFHCASLGEFEQGRPLIEAIKAVSPQSTILLSFFSPSVMTSGRTIPLLTRSFTSRPIFLDK